MLESVLDGAVEFVSASGDKSDLDQIKGIYWNTSKYIESEIRPEETCLLTFPSMLVRPDLRVGCLGIVMEDRVVIVWFTGKFRVKIGHQVIQRSRISGVEWGQADARSPYLLTIHADEDTQLALPAANPGLGDLIKDRILQSSPS